MSARNSDKMKAAERWFDQLSPESQRVVALNCLERMLVIDEIRYSEDRDEVYWVSCGESLDVPF